VNDISRKKILEFMEQRMTSLQHQIEQDFGGGLNGRLEAWREVKYWKEAIERGEFDFKDK
jgi:hypothetical protein